MSVGVYGVLLCLLAVLAALDAWIKRRAAVERARLQEALKEWGGDHEQRQGDSNIG